MKSQVSSNALCRSVGEVEAALPGSWMQFMLGSLGGDVQSEKLVPLSPPLASALIVQMFNTSGRFSLISLYRAALRDCHSTQGTITCTIWLTCL